MKKNLRYGGLAAFFLLVMAGIVAADWFSSPAQHPTSKKPDALVTTFKDDPRTSRAFTWHTDQTGTKSVLQFMEGTDADSFAAQAALTIEGTTSIIADKDGQQEGVHRVEAAGLKPGTSYIYRVGSGTAEEWSEPALFKTEAASVTAYTFIDVADSQGSTDADFKLWGNTLTQAFTQFPDAQFIVHNGDLTEDPELEASWRSFFSYAQPWLSRIPLMPVTGNHDEVEGNADRFASHFTLPDNGQKDSTPGTNYSFDYGSVHYVVLNTESNMKKQAEWLRKDLSATDQPWKIVAIHRPAYGGNETDNVIKRWVPLFDEFGVNLVLQGHNHEYARSYPLRDGQIMPEGQGTVYVVTNTSGPKFNEKKADQFYQQVHFQNEKQMYAGITVTPTSLTYEAYDVEGHSLDTFTLTP